MTQNKARTTQWPAQHTAQRSMGSLLFFAEEPDCLAVQGSCAFFFLGAGRELLIGFQLLYVTHQWSGGQGILNRAQRVQSTCYHYASAA